MFGSIVFMPTGSGKTLIAIMLILKIFGMYDPTDLDFSDENEIKIKKLNYKELFKKKDLAQKPTEHKKKVAFLVPTTNLVEQ